MLPLIILAISVFSIGVLLYTVKNFIVKKDNVRKLGLVIISCFLLIGIFSYKAGEDVGKTETYNFIEGKEAVYLYPDKEWHLVVDEQTGETYLRSDVTDRINR